MSQVENERTTITVRRDTHQRFQGAKPYKTISADEFVDVLLDHWEGKR